VTTTPRRLADIVLTTIRADLDGDPFDVTVCGDEVSARKPDPAPYRQAMAALGVEPSECVVVEDSESGVAAGLAAGVAVLGVPAVQEIRASPGLTLRRGLVGVRVAELAAMLAARPLHDTQARAG
jgi:beta-phosphoglucomutase-like phosphatase (HAD superfamily)